MISNAYRFDGLHVHSGRLCARFVAPHDTRVITLVPAVMPAPLTDATAPHPDPDLQADLVRRAREELARARSVAALVAFDRGEHLHRPRRVYPHPESRSTR